MPHGYTGHTRAKTRTVNGVTLRQTGPAMWRWDDAGLDFEFIEDSPAYWQAFTDRANPERPRLRETFALGRTLKRCVADAQRFLGSLADRGLTGPLH